MRICESDADGLRICRFDADLRKVMRIGCRFADRLADLPNRLADLQKPVLNVNKSVTNIAKRLPNITKRVLSITKVVPKKKKPRGYAQKIQLASNRGVPLIAASSDRLRTRGV